DTNISQIQEDDNGDYFVEGKFTSPGVCKLDVSADDEPINQSPMTIKVEEGRLVNTIQINATSIIDVVKCKDDSLLVSCLTNEMLKYKQSGEYIGKVTLPQGVKVDRMYKMKNGNIAFSDFNYKPIRICNMNGQLIKTISEEVQNTPRSIHVDETSNVLYAASGWSNSCVYMFDMNNGKTIKTIGLQGTKEGQMSYVTDVTLTNQGHLLVLEYSNSRLQLFNNEGRFIKVLVEAGDEDGKVNSPSAIVVDEDDNIIISSQQKLQLFSSDGNFIKRIDKPEDRINDPRGLSIISYHPRRLAVANRGDKTVKIFNY
ncbi:tripartite motif-containing protein 2-like, partial [Anneissia japonica]|uniref:tripartite motif-containing protein 2-like n=1 Tax=Anneissia japonica TaxID=1529436 RepID=UPI0014254F0A